jgi:hypothetical protein
MEGLRKAARPDAARAQPDRYKHVNAPKQRATLSGGGPTKVFRPNPAPLRVLGHRRRGEHVRGAWEEGSIAPRAEQPRSGARRPTTLGACFIGPYQDGPTTAETQRSYPDFFVRRKWAIEQS